MADLLANDGPKGGEVATPTAQNNSLLKKWQGFLKIAIDDKLKMASEIKRGKELYHKTDAGSGSAADVRDGRTVVNSINHAKNGIDIVVDQVYQRNPKMVAKARAPVYITSPDPMTGMITQTDVSSERALVIEEVMNHEMGESSLKSEAKACIRSAHIAPEAWIQTGYQFDEDNQIDSIFFRYRSVKEVFPDPHMKIYEGVIRRCRFIALKWTLTADEAQSMGMDPAILKKSGDSKNEDSETETFEVYDMWDRTTMMRGYVTEHGAQFPSEPGKWPWELDGFPFDVMRFGENPDCRWSRSPIIEVESLQMELDQQRETMNIHVINARPVKLYDASLDENDVNVLASRGKGVWKSVKGLAERKELIKIFNDDPLDNEFYAHYERNKQEMAEVLKFRSADLLQTTGSTATESQDVARKGANQIGSKIDIVEVCIKNVIKKAKKIMEQTYTTDRMTEISGKDGNKFWVRWSGGILADTDVDIEVGSTEKEDNEKRLQVALNMLGTMMQVPGMNVLELAVDVLRKSDYRDVDRYKSQPALPPPMPGQPPVTGPGGGVATSPTVQPDGIAGQINPMV